MTAEIGNTVTAGFVWRPIPELSVALDGYRIVVSDAITQVNGATTAFQNQCYASGGTSPYCELQDRPNGFADRIGRERGDRLVQRVAEYLRRSKRTARIWK